MPEQAWVAKGPMSREPIELGPLAAEDVEIAVEHCGLCHSDLSVPNVPFDWDAHYDGQRKKYAEPRSPKHSRVTRGTAARHSSTAWRHPWKLV